MAHQQADERPHHAQHGGFDDGVTGGHRSEAQSLTRSEVCGILSHRPLRPSRRSSWRWYPANQEHVRATRCAASPAAAALLIAGCGGGSSTEVHPPPSDTALAASQPGELLEHVRALLRRARRAAPARSGRSRLMAPVPAPALAVSATGARAGLLEHHVQEAGRRRGRPAQDRRHVGLRARYHPAVRAAHAVAAAAGAPSQRQWRHRAGADAAAAGRAPPLRHAARPAAGGHGAARGGAEPNRCSRSADRCPARPRRCAPRRRRDLPAVSDEVQRRSAIPLARRHRQRARWATRWRSTGAWLAAA